MFYFFFFFEGVIPFLSHGCILEGLLVPENSFPCARKIQQYRLLKYVQQSIIQLYLKK
jgi:hypothetical protein